MREGLSDMKGTSLRGLPPALKKCWAGQGMSPTGLASVCARQAESDGIAAVETPVEAANG